MARLAVNIDHVATVRQARGGPDPDPVWAAALAQLGGADGITVHLREDRRHIQDRDLRLLRETVTVRLNLEMACTDEMVAIARANRPELVTLVPERREEVTTEGGLDVAVHRLRVLDSVRQLKDLGLEVSLFIDPTPRQIELAREVGADAVELHTGAYALAAEAQRNSHLEALETAAKLAQQLGLVLHAGHGLNYHNVSPVARLVSAGDLNIGHSIVARALWVGLPEAVRQMKQLVCV